MRHILISLALMLRVWFSSRPHGDSPISGLVVGNTANGDLIVAIDKIDGKKINGGTVRVRRNRVESSKWVEVKGESEK